VYTSAVAWLPPGIFLVAQDIIRRSLAMVALTIPLLRPNWKLLKLLELPSAEAQSASRERC
jgi:hypothetical protein